MSRILRRPMFRGGRVNSYGTGIASGLADGGRVGFRTGGSYLSQAITPSAVTEAYKPQGISPGFLEFLRGDIYSGQNRMPDFSKINREGLSGLEDYGVIPTEEVNQFKDLDLDTGERKKYASIPSTSDAVEKVETETEEVIEPGLGDTGIATQTMAEFEPELKKQRTVKQPTLKETEENEVTMTDLERALGLDDARKEYVGDALAAASKAFFEGRGFEAISDAAQVKSKAPEIKRLAGLEEYKQEMALKRAQAKKQYAPGNYEKNFSYLKSKFPEFSDEKILKILNKQPSSFQEQYIDLAKEYKYKNEDVFKDAAKLFYGGRYRGDQQTVDLKDGEKVELSDGVYTDSKNGIVYEITDKTVKILSKE